MPPPAEYIGRFAPSPTGPLHFGSLVAALASYLDARAHGGRWLLRIEDVDETRCKTQFGDDILRTLQAFELHWDGEVMTQSVRKPRYAQALTQLTLAGLAYSCTCSRREIADSAIFGLEGSVYPGTCRSAHHAGPGHAIRVLTGDEPLRFIDRVQGPVEQRLQSQLGDFVIKRRDGLFSYQLAVVVDDADQNISHVVRGADLIDSTTRQIHLQQLLGLPTPRYLHIPIAINEAGQKLSKQTLAPGIGHDDIRPILQQALRFLGQAAGDEALPARAMLATAVRTWTVAAIPTVRQRTIPPE
ncbi:MAG TPA: tRNA glutamyl-Q(34) synthetase GluQRS [Usitatibacteraceae bacterium]